MNNFNFIETPNSTGKVIDTITLTANDYLSFPTFFMEKHKLKEVGLELFTKLYYDKQHNAIAIQFTQEKAAGLYRVNVSTQYGATCKIKSFLLNNEIDTKKYTGKYEYKKYAAQDIGLEGGDIYVLTLNGDNDEKNQE